MARPPVDRRSAQAAGTRRRLLDAGRRAFAERGLAGVNLTRDVLDPAGVSVGSFYHQFRDKTELLLAILEEHSERVRARFREVHRPAAGRTPEQIARASYALFFDLVDQQTDAARILIRERAESEPDVRRFIQREQRRWRASLAADYQRIAEAYGLSFEVELAADLIAMLARGAVEHYVELPPEERAKERDRLLGGLVRLTLRGLPGLVPDAASVPATPLPEESTP